MLTSGQKLTIAIVVLFVSVIIVISVLSSMKVAGYENASYSDNYGLTGGRLQDASCPYCSNNNSSIGTTKLTRNNFEPYSAMKNKNKSKKKERFHDDFTANVPLSNMSGLEPTRGSVFYGFQNHNVNQFEQGVDD